MSTVGKMRYINFKVSAQLSTEFADMLVYM